jgi:hypothetical protein
MDRLIKSLWFLMFAFTVFGLLSLIPIDKMQKAYLTNLNRAKQEPQRRVDATYRYVEAVESGDEDISKGISSQPPAKYYKDDVNTYDKVNNANNRKFLYPLYIRDKHNPKILYKVRKP